MTLLIGLMIERKYNMSNTNITDYINDYFRKNNIQHAIVTCIIPNGFEYMTYNGTHCFVPFVRMTKDNSQE